MGPPTLYWVFLFFCPVSTPSFPHPLPTAFSKCLGPDEQASRMPLINLPHLCVCRCIQRELITGWAENRGPRCCWLPFKCSGIPGCPFKPQELKLTCSSVKTLKIGKPYGNPLGFRKPLEINKIERKQYSGIFLCEDVKMDVQPLVELTLQVQGIYPGS